MGYLTIETAQNVEIEYNVANVGARIGAQMIDYLVYVAYILLIIWLQTSFDFIEYFFDGFLIVIALAAPLVFYSLVMELAYDGQTVGKMLLKIKVVRLDGMPVSFGDYLLRWILVLVDLRLFGGIVAVVVILINGKGQRLGDLAAGTTVVSLKSPISLSDTAFSDISEDYEIQFPEVSLLGKDDIETIYDVTRHVSKNNGSKESIDLAYKAKKALEAKMEIRNDMRASDFFKIVIKDYNAYTIRENFKY